MAELAPHARYEKPCTGGPPWPPRSYRWPPRFPTAYSSFSAECLALVTASRSGAVRRSSLHPSESVNAGLSGGLLISSLYLVQSSSFSLLWRHQTGTTHSQDSLISSLHPSETTGDGVSARRYDRTVPRPPLRGHSHCFRRDNGAMRTRSESVWLLSNCA